MVIEFLKKIGLTIGKSLQFLIISILSGLTWAIEMNNVKWKNRWLFECADFNRDPDNLDYNINWWETYIELIKNIWR